MCQAPRKINNPSHLSPVKKLKEVIKYTSKGEALDIGAGNGRNSFFLAKNGFKVTAIDISPDKISSIKETSKKLGLEINAKSIDVRKFDFPRCHYSLILAISVLDFLKRKEIEKVINEVKKSLTKDGVVYVSVFSIRDNFMRELKKRGFKEVEKNTFYLPKPNIFRHFFTKEEIKELFRGLKTIELKEERFLDKTHGFPHYHNTIEFIGRKTEEC